MRSKDEVLDELCQVAFGNADDTYASPLKYASKLRALELLGKHFGLFSGTGCADKPVIILDDIGDVDDENGLPIA